MNRHNEVIWRVFPCVTSNMCILIILSAKWMATMVTFKWFSPVRNLTCCFRLGCRAKVLGHSVQQQGFFCVNLHMILKAECSCKGFRSFWSRWKGSLHYVQLNVSEDQFFWEKFQDIQNNHMAFPTVRFKVEGFGLEPVATYKYLLCPWYSFCPKNHTELHI